MCDYIAIENLRGTFWIGTERELINLELYHNSFFTECSGAKANAVAPEQYKLSRHWMQ